MPRISDDDKATRRERVLMIMQRHEERLTTQEIAGYLGLERRTVDNYLYELETEGKLYKDGKYWLAFPVDAIQLRRFEPTPEEAVILYLAARLLVKQSDRRNEAAESMLYKLARILSDDIRLGDDIADAARLLAERPRSDESVDIFRAVVRAYVYRRRLQITYAPYLGQPFETVISPYLIEPSGIGYATYVIGHSSLVDTLRTYKIERIQRAQILREPYEIPTDFPGIDILRNAWVIFHGEETTHVVLRFRPDTSKRVRESNWHPSQKLVDDPSRPGYLQLHIDVADTTDLKPWIRGWGAACEVLEPVELRTEIVEEVALLARLYGVGQAQDARTILDDLYGGGA